VGVAGRVVRAALARERLWTWRDLAAHPPASLGGWAHALVLASYVPLLVGLLGLPSAPRDPAHRRRFVLDLAVTVLGAALVVWCLVIRPAAGESSAGLLAHAAELTPRSSTSRWSRCSSPWSLGRVDAGSRTALRLLAAGQLLSGLRRRGHGRGRARPGRSPPATGSTRSGWCRSRCSWRPPTWSTAARATRRAGGGRRRRCRRR
jgi:hypothetical protein